MAHLGGEERGEQIGPFTRRVAEHRRDGGNLASGRAKGIEGGGTDIHHLGVDRIGAQPRRPGHAGAVRAGGRRFEVVGLVVWQRDQIGFVRSRDDR